MRSGFCVTDSALNAPDRAQLLRYLGGAGLCALANNVVLIVAAARGVSNLPAVIMAWLTGGTIGYLWHHSVTFRTAARWRGYFQMMAGSAIGIPLAWGAIALLRGPLGLPMWAAAIVATVAMALYNYLNARLAITRRFMVCRRRPPA